MPNPLDFVTTQDILELGLSLDDLDSAYQPSSGGIYHARGAEGVGKTLWLAHLYRYLIDGGRFTPYDATGNITFKGKYGQGYTVRKGEALRQYLWDMTHKPLTHKIVVVDEIDSEFPARMFASYEQTELANRMWHVLKLDNFILESSHLGTSTDLIFMLSSHYVLYPEIPDFETSSLDYTLVDNLHNVIDKGLTAHDVIRTMLIYHRKELTEDMDAERLKSRTKQQKKQALEFEQEPVDEIDEEKEF